VAGRYVQRADELLSALLAHEHDLRAPARGDAGRDEVGPFHQEGALALTELAMPQRRRPFDEGVLRAGDGLA
jgi:hypothetical protein